MGLWPLLPTLGLGLPESVLPCPPRFPSRPCLHASLQPPGQLVPCEQPGPGCSGAHGRFPLSPVPSVQPAVQENGDDAGEAREAGPGSPRRCDIITISGRKEKCAAAKEALEVRAALSPPRGHGTLP